MPTDPDAPGNEPNLELPSFGFGRRKKRGKKSSDDPDAAAPTGAAPGTGGDAPEPPAAEGTLPSAAESAAESTAPLAPPAPARTPGASPATPPARPPARPAARPPSRPPAAAAPSPAPPRPASPPAAQPAVTQPAVAQPAVTQPPVTQPPVSVPTGTQPEAGHVPEPFLEPAGNDPLDRTAAAMDEPRTTRTGRRGGREGMRARRRAEKGEAKRAKRAASPADVEPSTEGPREALVTRLPAINPLVAAILSGVLSGLSAVLLAFGASRGCESVRGTDSCGGGLGLLALAAILVIEVLIGANLLKAWRIPDPYSTSFLGVGVVATIAMLVFLDHIDSPWMFLVIPLMTAASFALSWWVTVRFIDEHPMTSEKEAELGEPAFPAHAVEQDEESNA